MTNTVSHFFINSREDEDSVVVRVNGVAGFLDREKELVAFERLSAAGIADQLIATFKNGLVMKPIKGSTLHRDTIKTNEVASHVARAMAQMHRKTKLLATETEPELIRQMRQFISLIPEQYSDVSFSLKTVQPLQSNTHLYFHFLGAERSRSQKNPTSRPARARKLHPKNERSP